MRGRLVGEGAVHQLHDLRLGGCAAQGCGEVLFDKGAGQLGEQLQVNLVCTVSGGKDEDEVRGAVVGAKDHVGLRAALGVGVLRDGGRAAVRDGAAAGDSRGRFLFAGVGVGEEAVNLGCASRASN